MPTITYELGSVAEWLSGIGTVAATSIALWLAVRDDSERLGITLHIHGDVFEFIVYNSGTKPVILKDIGFDVGRFSAAHDNSLEAILVGRGGRLPVKLAPAEDFTDRMTISYDPSYLPDRLFKLSSERVWWNRKLYFVAETGTARRIRYRVPSVLADRLIRKSSAGS